MKKMRYLIVLIILLQQVNIAAQNVMWLTSGKKLSIGEYKKTSPDLIIYKNMKGKSKSVQTFDVFLVTDKSGKEEIIYSPDTSYTDALTLVQMRSFVQGEYDAELKFKTPLTTIGGIAIAGASSVVINPIYVLLISTAYCSSIGISKPFKAKLNIPSEFSQDKYYILGYKKTVKHKRIKNAIIGSGIGLLAGLGTFAIISKK